MPKTKKQRKATAATKAKQAIVVAPKTDYKAFLESLVKKKPANLAKAAINKWRDTNPQEDTGKIINEIAKKFNNNNNLGIGMLKYNKAAGQPNFYEGMTPNDKTQMTLAPPPSGSPLFGLVATGPLPRTVAHELVHANDHQIDHLNPLVWGNLATLANTGGNTTAKSMNDFKEFSKSISKIQDKIDPTKAFSTYPIDQNYITDEINAAKGYTIRNQI